MKAMRTAGTPNSGDTLPLLATRKNPATPASIPAIAKVMAITRSALTPSRRAISKSSAAARISIPIEVRRITSTSPAMSAADTTMTVTSRREIATPPRSNDRSSPLPTLVVRGSDPNTMIATFWSR